jgi:cytoskeletal protein RodZ
MNSVGNILRTERERQGREVAEIAEALCITQRYLRAIEQDDLKSLPGTFFYKSFVKQYAAILGIDDASLQPGVSALTSTSDPLPLPGADARYVPQETQASSKPIRDLDPIVKDGNRLHFGENRVGLSIAALVAVLLGCSAFYSWYNRAPQPAATAKVEAPRATIVPVVKSEPEPSTPKIDVTTTTGPNGENQVVLNVSATEKTWLSISADGKQIFSGVLEPSQTKTLTGVEVAKMKVGWNGKEIGPIGPRGQVRVLKFTKENFEILHPSDAM